MFSKCDKEMENKGVPCDCPIPTGLFTIPTQSITVTKEQIENMYSTLSWFVEVYKRLFIMYLLCNVSVIHSNKNNVTR